MNPVQQPPGSGDPSDPLISPDYAGWWQRNINILKAYWRPLAVLQAFGAVAELVLLIPADLVQALQARGLQGGNPAAREIARALPGLGAGLLGAILAALVVTLVTMAGMRLVVVAVTGGQPDVGDALRGALRRLPPLAGWGLLASLLVLFGLCLCLLPGLYFAAVFTVLPAVVLFERGGAIGRCFKLFHAEFAASLARVATIIGLAIAATLVTMTVDGIVGAIVRAGSVATGALVSGTLVSTVLAVAVNAALGVVLAPLTLTTYADERARLEPLHTGVLAHELATA
jgi:hypothetical protein